MCAHADKIIVMLETLKHRHFCCMTLPVMIGIDIEEKAN
jgi:hypothetical protein